MVRPEPCVRPESLNYIRPEIIGDLADMNDPDKMGDHEDRYGTKSKSLGRIIQAFKSTTTHRYIQGIMNSNFPAFQKHLWQRNYYEHIIRNEGELDHSRRYILDNPFMWLQDEENPLKIL